MALTILVVAGISDIVSVSIAIQDSAPKAVEFDTIVVVADAPFLGGRLYSISPQGLSAMTTDGFATHARARQIISRMSGQSGGAGQAYVWGRTAQQTQTVDFTVDIALTAVGTVIAFDLSYAGVTSTISVTVATNTVNAILDLIEAAIDASAAGIAGVGVAPDNATATKLTLTAGTPGQFFQLDGFPASIQLTDVSTAGTGFAAELAAMKAELGESVYGLLIDGYSESEIALAAAFAEANHMVFLGQTADNAVITNSSTDIASDLETAGYTRSTVFFSRYMSGDGAAALLGRQLGQTPGSSNWHMQTLTGVSADTLSSAAHAFARGKNAITYTTDRNVAHTWDGKAASGRPFDITHGVDALQADIETRVYQVLLNAEKVPFNATGLSMIESPIRAALAAAEGNIGVPGTIEPGWTVTMPSLQGYSSVDKAARLLRTVLFTAQMTGAVNSVTVAGTLTL
jgi:hypothetical protein